MSGGSYQSELDELRAEVRSMGELVLDRLDVALEAVETGDERLAAEAAGGDAPVNERYLEIESRCIDLFGTRGPLAGDLRFVTASFKITTDLERVGDLATNLGEYARTADPERLSVDVTAVGRDARDQVAAALEAYVEEDAAACRRIAARDDDLDAACASASERVVRELIEHEAEDDPWAVERLIDEVSAVLLTLRDLERVGDHAVNVAARTLYAVENDPELIY